MGAGIGTLRRVRRGNAASSVNAGRAAGGLYRGRRPALLPLCGRGTERGTLCKATRLCVCASLPMSKNGDSLAGRCAYEENCRQSLRRLSCRQADGREANGGYIVWKCRCVCGKENLLDTRALQRGAILDCGCNTVVKPGQRDITGMRFGMLVALRRPANRKRMSVPFGTAAVTAAVRLLVSPVFDEVVLPGLLV